MTTYLLLLGLGKFRRYAVFLLMWNFVSVRSGVLVLVVYEAALWVCNVFAMFFYVFLYTFILVFLSYFDEFRACVNDLAE
jgi:hypothetical protein